MIEVKGRVEGVNRKEGIGRSVNKAEIRKEG